MHISWIYLNKRDATIHAIESFTEMDYIFKNTEEEIKTVESRLAGISSPGMDGMPHAHNPGAIEEKVASDLDEIDLLKERYRQAEEYMSWFKPAWDQLSDDDRYVLETCFMGGEEHGAMQMVANYFGVERTSAYKKRNRALNRLRVLLYGAV